MDLRKYALGEQDLALACQLLHYQPFILSDDLHTGVAYSWLYGEEGSRQSTSADWICDRRRAAPEHWNRFVDATARQRQMYEDWLAAIVAHFPGGSLVDVGCCSGYFPLRAQQLGMKECAGYDPAPYGPSITLLNRVLGTQVPFYQGGYDFVKRTLPGCKGYDVAVASAVLCHLPDPLHFLACLGKIARKGIFLFTGFGSESDELTIHYKSPNRFYKDRVFPYNFDDDTGLSRGLLFKSLEWMGFKKVVEIGHRESWLPRAWYGTQKALLFLR